MRRAMTALTELAENASRLFGEISDLMRLIEENAFMAKLREVQRQKYLASDGPKTREDLRQAIHDATKVPIHDWIMEADPAFQRCRWCGVQRRVPTEDA